MQEWLRRNTRRDFFEFSRVKAAAIDGDLLLHANEQWVGDNSTAKKTRGSDNIRMKMELYLVEFSVSVDVKVHVSPFFLLLFKNTTVFFVIIDCI